MQVANHLAFSFSSQKRISLPGNISEVVAVSSASFAMMLNGWTGIPTASARISALCAVRRQELSALNPTEQGNLLTGDLAQSDFVYESIQRDAMSP